MGLHIVGRQRVSLSFGGISYAHEESHKYARDEREPLSAPSAHGGALVRSNVYNNFNQIYMAGLMTAPMVLIELFVMRAMYQDKRRNLLIIAISIIALLGFFLLIRQQTAIHDRQFLRSMIPHHAGAILMCEQASIQDHEIQELCGTIISGQQSEIDQMKAILDRLQR